LRVAGLCDPFRSKGRVSPHGVSGASVENFVTPTPRVIPARSTFSAPGVRAHRTRPNGHSRKGRGVNEAVLLLKVRRRAQPLVLHGSSGDDDAVQTVPSSLPLPTVGGAWGVGLKPGARALRRQLVAAMLADACRIHVSRRRPRHPLSPSTAPAPSPAPLGGSRSPSPTPARRRRRGGGLGGRTSSPVT
jgi:hypothetical protein